MKLYEPSTPRAALGLTAVAMAMITMGVMVGMPAVFEAASPAKRDTSLAKGAIMTRTYEGSCFCGAVQLAVTGEPVAAGFCHCASCRSWSAAPVNAFSLWKPEAVKITQGEDSIGTYHKTERSYRKFCTVCGGHLFTDHPMWDLVDVYAATIPAYRHAPALHVHYGETALRMRDGLPKMKDLPKEMGGSGELCAE